MTWISS